MPLFKAHYNFLNMEAIVTTILAGLLSTAAMSGFLYLVHFSGAANADMIRALGSMLTKNFDNAMLAGLVTHAISGVMFAFPYAIVLGLAPVSGYATTAVGGLVGFFHGFVFSFMLIALIAESHPIERFRNAGVSVAVVHLLAHVVYGSMMGFAVTAFAIDFGITLLR